MKTFRRALGALAAALAAAHAPPALALSFDSIPTFDAMVSTAPLVVRGRVLAVGDGQAPVTGSTPVPYGTVTLRVDQSFAGSAAGSTITLRQMGGRMPGQPNRMMLIPGLAEFEPGEEVYVVADDRKQPFFATLYGDHGLFRVATDAAGVQRVLTHGWQVLRTNGKPWKTAALRYCKPRVDDRRRCTLVTETAHDRSDTHDVKPPLATDADVTPAAFDARLRSLLAGKANGAGQTVSANPAQFEAALAELRARGLRMANTLTAGRTR